MGDSIKVVHSILGHHWLRISKDNNAMMKGIFPPEYPIGRVRATAPTFDEPTIRRNETNTRYRSGGVSLVNDQ